MRDSNNRTYEQQWALEYVIRLEKRIRETGLLKKSNALATVRELSSDRTLKGPRVCGDEHIVWGRHEHTTHQECFAFYEPIKFEPVPITLAGEEGVVPCSIA